MIESTEAARRFLAKPPGDDPARLWWWLAWEVFDDALVARLLHEEFYGAVEEDTPRWLPIECFLVAARRAGNELPEGAAGIVGAALNTGAKLIEATVKNVGIGKTPIISPTGRAWLDAQQPLPDCVGSNKLAHG